MTNICTKVTVRKRPIKNGQVSLYLDFYPPVRHPKTGKPTRREYLGIYIYANPSDKFEAEFNKTMLRNAELIKCRRTEAIINEEYGFLDRNRGKENFLEYFRSKMADDDNFRNWNTAYKHFEKYCCGSCTFDDLTLEYCQGFLTYLLSLTTQTKGKMMASTANNNLNKLKCVLRIAYEERRIKENIAPRLKHAKEASTRREFLTLEEVRMLADTPCEKPVIRSAALFSCLTGLRISDIIRSTMPHIKSQFTGINPIEGNRDNYVDAYRAWREVDHVCAEWSYMPLTKDPEVFPSEGYLIKTRGGNAVSTTVPESYFYAKFSIASGRNKLTLKTRNFSATNATFFKVTAIRMDGTVTHLAPVSNTARFAEAAADGCWKFIHEAGGKGDSEGYADFVYDLSQFNGEDVMLTIGIFKGEANDDENKLVMRGITME